MRAAAPRTHCFQAAALMSCRRCCSHQGWGSHSGGQTKSPNPRCAAGALPGPPCATWCPGVPLVLGRRWLWALLSLALSLHIISHVTSICSALLSLPGRRHMSLFSVIHSVALMTHMAAGPRRRAHLAPRVTISASTLLSGWARHQLVTHSTEGRASLLCPAKGTGTSCHTAAVHSRTAVSILGDTQWGRTQKQPPEVGISVVRGFGWALTSCAHIAGTPWPPTPSPLS